MQHFFTPEDIFAGREVWFHDNSVGAGTVRGRAGNVVPQRSGPRNRIRGGRLLQKRIEKYLLTMKKLLIHLTNSRKKEK